MKISLLKSFVSASVSWLICNYENGPRFWVYFQSNNTLRRYKWILSVSRTFMAGSRIIEGNVAGIDGSPNFSSIKIFLRQVRQKLQIKAELETCNIGNCTPWSHKIRKRKTQNRKLHKASSVSSRKKLGRILQRHRPWEQIKMAEAIKHKTRVLAEKISEEPLSCTF